MSIFTEIYKRGNVHVILLFFLAINSIIPLKVTQNTCGTRVIVLPKNG